MITDIHVFQYPPPRLPSPHVPWCPPALPGASFMPLLAGVPGAPEDRPSTFKSQGGGEGGGLQGSCVPASDTTRHEIEARAQKNKSKNESERPFSHAEQVGGYIFPFAAEDLKGDREIVLEVVQQDGSALTRHPFYLCVLLPSFL